MRAFIRRLPPSAEFICVVAICFGYPIYASFWWLGSDLAGPVTFTFTDWNVFSLLVSEGAALAVAGFILAVRGWKLSDASMVVSWNFTLGGLLLLAVYYVTSVLSYALVNAAVGADILDQVQFSSQLSPGLIVVISVLNPVFEEVIVVAYVIQVLEKKYGIIFAIGISTLIRLLYHLYQGPIAAVNILPLGILFGVVYWRWKSLWPLVVAHALADFIALV